MGDLDAGTFPLLVLAVLETEELELILIVVTPLKTMDVGGQKGAIFKELFCTEIDKSWLVQMVSELSVGMHMHEDDSSPLTMRLLLRHDCPELETHTMGVCD